MEDLSSKAVRCERGNVGDSPERQGDRYKFPLHYSRHQTPFHSPCVYIEALFLVLLSDELLSKRWYEIRSGLEGVMLR
jgi:hypothetical protein